MGELARKPGAPTFPNTPTELLTPRPGEGYSPLDMYMLPVVGTLTGPAIVYAANLLARRPGWAGIYNHLLFGAAGYFLSTYWRDFRLRARAEKDAVFLHYVSLHPEDFPPFERKRYKDIFMRWEPVR